MTFNSKRLQAIRRYAQAQIINEQFAGIAWSLFQHGEVVEEGVLGHADHGKTRPLEADAIYRLYSMTKPVVSVRCLQLVEAGLIRLDDTVSSWIPAFADQQVLTSDGRLIPLARPITVEDLLTHRSGLSYDFLPDCAVANQYRDAALAAQGSRPLAELVNILATCPLASQPGARWYYSYATDVLAHLIECVCDQSIDEDLQQALFEPLGMHETGYRVSQSQQHRLADMFGQRELGDVALETGTTNRLLAMSVEESYPASGVSTFLRGGIGLFSTISDYRRFMDVLMHGRAPDGDVVLSGPMLNLLWQNRLSVEQMPIDIAGIAYAGYGWGLTGRVLADLGACTQLSALGEGGWAGAASTYFWVDRSNAVSGIVMAQYLGSNVPLGADIQGLSYAALSDSRLA